MKTSIINGLILSALTLSPLALANQAGDFVVRGGATMVNPDSDKSNIMLGGADSTMTLTVDDNTQLGLNFVYFYDSNWAIELLAATPFTHDVTIQDKNSVLGVDGANLGEVSQLPPTLSALYYFDTNSAFKPYVGLGINYTVFFDEDFASAPKSLGLSNLELDGSFGLSAQVGVDYKLDDTWTLNASMRYIDIDAEATFDVAGNSIGKADINVDPMVYSLMLGYKF
ncbi:outer membrane protein OmpW [Colwellia sp. Arc7-635]|uniref:OmpW/AlkL family protein n=1 Tax=Colwellia sp. Arc7-635 TaxID=2497879 RepID=UPI000F8529A5|nr:OmpW family outer membrane protein [Colwellia sp. Arc7-635]AZQ82620.1 outer membrane protein OmpW [Colwellia sp. Arc7-635]